MPVETTDIPINDDQSLSVGVSVSVEQNSLVVGVRFGKAWIQHPWEDITFGRANTARTIYTVKDVRQAEVSWSRFEFVTPPKFESLKTKI